MATVRLGLYELEEYDLPRVCMCCGAPTRYAKTKKFQWFPPWAFLLLGVLGALIFSKRATVDIPLCDRHKWHWGIRTAIALVGILILVGLGIGVALVASENQDLAPYLVIPLLLVFVGWLVLLIYLGVTTIRPTEITDKSITLKGVSEEFVDALEEARRGDSGRSRWGRSHDNDDEDDDRPRRRRRNIEDEDDPRVFEPEARRRREDRERD